MAPHTHNATVAHDMLYGPVAGGIRARFPGVPLGVNMLETVNRVYKPVKKRWKFFDEVDGKQVPTMQAHRLNNRQQDVVINDYVGSICEFGLHEECRGAAWAQYNTDKHGPILLISSGQLGTSVLRAAIQHPKKEDNRPSSRVDTNKFQPSFPVHPYES